MCISQYDVVVVGAGPAGTSTAKAVAEAGFKVLILEEHPQVGYPVQCSGLVSPRTMEVANVGEELIVNQLTGALIRTPSGAELQLGGDRVRALVLDRALLDQTLASDAQDAGAELCVGSRLRGIERTNGELVLSVYRGSRKPSVRIQTRLLVGADGWSSVVARWMGRVGDQGIWTVSLDGELPNHGSELAQVFVGQELAPGWFGWSIPLGENRVRVGVGCEPSPTNRKPGRVLKDLLSAFPKTFAGLRPLSYTGGYIPIYQRNDAIPTYSDNTLLVGDAARQVKPTSGGGIYTSLIAGKHAATAAIDALRHEDLSAAMLTSYEETWRAEFEREFERGLEIRQMYIGLGDEQLDTVLHLLGHKRLRRIISRYGDIDFPSFMFARLALASPAIRGLVALSHVLPIRWLGALGQEMWRRVGRLGQ